MLNPDMTEKSLMHVPSGITRYLLCCYCCFILLCVFCLVFKTGFLCVAQGVLELILKIRLFVNLQKSAYFSLSSVGIKGMHHYNQAKKAVFVSEDEFRFKNILIAMRIICRDNCLRGHWLTRLNM